MPRPAFGGKRESDPGSLVDSNQGLTIGGGATMLFTFLYSRMGLDQFTRFVFHEIQ